VIHEWLRCDSLITRAAKITSTLELDGSVSGSATFDNIVVIDSSRNEGTLRQKGESTFGATATPVVISTAGKVTASDTVVSEKGFRSDGLIYGKTHAVFKDSIGVRGTSEFKGDVKIGSSGAAISSFHADDQDTIVFDFGRDAYHPYAKYADTLSFVIKENLTWENTEIALYNRDGSGGSIRTLGGNGLIFGIPNVADLGYIMQNQGGGTTYGGYYYPDVNRHFGLRAPANKGIGLLINDGTAASLFVDANGNTGLGMDYTSPSARLHVSGAGGSAIGQIIDANKTTENILEWSNDNTYSAAGDSAGYVDSEGNLHIHGTGSFGSWGYTGEHVVIGESSSNTNAGLGMYGMINYSATAGKVFAGTYSRALAMTANQTNLATIVGTESQFRLRDVNVGNGVHAGLWAYAEQSGTSVLSGGGTFDAISATVESGSGFTVGATEHVTGLTLDSSINGSATINASANFAGLYIKSNGKDWFNGIWTTGCANDWKLHSGNTINNSSADDIIYTGRFASSYFQSLTDISTMDRQHIISGTGKMTGSDPFNSEDQMQGGFFAMQLGEGDAITDARSLYGSESKVTLDRDMSNATCNLIGAFNKVSVRKTTTFAGTAIANKTILERANTATIAQGYNYYAEKSASGFTASAILGTRADTWDYGLKLDAATFGTADMILGNGATIDNTDASTLTITEANVIVVGDLSATTHSIDANEAIVLPAPGTLTDGQYAGARIITLTAGYGNTAIGELIYLNNDDSKFEKTDGNAAATAADVLVGIVLEVKAEDAACKVLLEGTITVDAWNWATVGASVWISGTAGEFTQTRLAVANDIVRIMGYALDDDTIYFCPDQIYVTVE